MPQLLAPMGFASGPLGRLARGLGRKLNAPVIEPIPEAVRQVAQVLGVNLRP